MRALLASVLGVLIVMGHTACGGGGNDPVGIVPAPTLPDATASSPSAAPLTCGGAAAPAVVVCGSPVARCNDGSWACWSCKDGKTGACASHGGVSCWVCPGPFCD